ncbi:hypothetical protein SEA_STARPLATINUM_280 [Streptomyces phage StarPlatinum]|uniref:Uncharacterized protein n=1 Tax=Streptomyces phage StarPlatinum TaxID=2283265 RepID=A0A345M8D8_9CAUD|nr:hypothetical protein HWB77_gp010 [Streptomyces phage StarPlatinum]YP_009839673.1 hypothetical protein HWB77_gp053 [Streptomyces phage StarPlatinum]AXH66759.1 hypothetical protein SEA_STARPLATINUM_10 [Streptomyces phage StarPlatinum]AXH66983.1 hypothetical protein SEA_STARPLATINUM_280 [Streptomyces phage StarPlatinum]
MDAMDVLKIFLDNGVEMGFTQAMEVADRIKGYHDVSMRANANDVYAEAYKKGVADGKIKAQNEGLTLSRPEIIRLRGIEDFAFDRAREAAERVVSEVGRDSKIRCIQKLRTEFPFLSIKEGKEIIETELNRLTALESYNYDDDDYDYGCGMDCSICG